MLEKKQLLTVQYKLWTMFWDYEFEKVFSTGSPKKFLFSLAVSARFPLKHLF